MVESSWKSPEEPLSIQRDLGDDHPKPSSLRAGVLGNATGFAGLSPGAVEGALVNEVEESRDTLASRHVDFTLMRPDRRTGCLLRLSASLPCAQSLRWNRGPGWAQAPSRLPNGPRAPRWAAPASGLAFTPLS